METRQNIIGINKEMGFGIVKRGKIESVQFDWSEERKGE